jgi:hypothetical protein
MNRIELRQYLRAAGGPGSGRHKGGGSSESSGKVPKSVSREKQGSGTRHWFNSKKDADAFHADKKSKGHHLVRGDDSSNADLGGPVHSVWVGPKGKASAETESYMAGIDPEMSDVLGNYR